MKLASRLLCLALFLCLTASQARGEDEGFKLRYPVMFTAGLVNLGLASLISYEAADVPLYDDDEDAFLPNDHLTPDDEEWVLIHKIADAHPNKRFTRSIRTISRAQAVELLRSIANEDEGSFAAEARSFLVTQKERRTSSRNHRESDITGEVSYAFAASPNRSVPGTDGELNPLLNLREGDFSEDEHLGSIGGTTTGKFVPWLTYQVSPHALLASNGDRRQSHARAYLRRGYLKANAKSFEVELGKDTVQWGLGDNGTMLFSGNAESLPLARIGNSRGVVLPGFLRHFGPARFDFFVGLLHDEREFRYTILHGMKTAFVPHPRFEFGFGQSIQIGGQGSNSWHPLNYFTEQLADQQTNRNFILDLRWRIPKLEVEPYAEFFWEDCCDEVFINPRDILNLFGLRVPNLGARGQGDLSLEWVRTNGITYRHFHYRSGYVYKGHLLGHPIGPDSMGGYAVFRYFHSPTLWWRLAGAVERYGRQDEVRPEDRFRGSLELHHRLGHPQVKLKWNGGYERVLNFNFQPNVDRHNFLIGIGLEIS